MIRGRTRTECQAALDRLCRLLGAVPTVLPTDRIGPGWVARAVAQRVDAPESTSR